MKPRLRERAIYLRKKGLSYSEILKKIPVAKSTLSVWFHSVSLSKKQLQRLTEKKLTAARRGAETRRIQRFKNTQKIKENAHKDINKITKRELWLMGTMLYWAEGAKEKIYRPGQGTIFSNSDPSMIRIFLKWLKKCINISSEQLTLEIYIHESYKKSVHKIRKYWSSMTGLPEAKFDRIYFKKDKSGTKRRNKGNSYYGLLRVRVKQSTDLNRKIEGWIEGVCTQCGVV